MAENLVSVLHAEIVRVRALLPIYEAIGPVGAFARLMFTQAIVAGEAALQSGAPDDMVRAIERLRGCTT